MPYGRCPLGGHRELCAIHKPGGVALPALVIVEAVALAAARASRLHEALGAALAALELTVERERELRLEHLRIALAQAQARPAPPCDGTEGVAGGAGKDKDGADVAMSSGGDDVVSQPVQGVMTKGGIDRDDPMLAWASLHQAAALREA